MTHAEEAAHYKKEADRLMTLAVELNLRGYYGRSSLAAYWANLALEKAKLAGRFAEIMEAVSKRTPR